jgi:hypothetical protein
MRSFRQILAFLFLLAVSCGPVWSQASLTSLRGTITDPSGALVPGATVTIEEKSTGFKANQTANGSGEYEFQQIPPGTYLITATSTGFGAQSKQAALLVNQPATVNFKLTLDTTTTTVDVSGEAQTLNVTDASIGNSFNNATIEALPMEGRNVPDLLSLQPGVLYLGRNIDKGSDSRSGAVAGARSDQTNVTLDGLDDNDQENGYAFTGVLRSTLDSVEEFRVTTTGSNADAGRSSGGQVSMVTKSGTNKFHGSAYEYYRPTNTVANDWFNKQAQLASGEPNIPGKIIRNTFGAAVGGPIQKDKLFFFGNYEGQRTAENQQVTQTVPTASFKAGDVVYPSGGTNVTLTPAQIATMDPNCSANGTCPWGPGDDPNMLAIFNQYYPTANGSAQGDGVNLGSYTFSSPYPGSLNTSIAKLDWTPTERHRLFVRGNLQKDTQSAVIQFPGQAPASLTEDNSKGIAAGDTWSISSSLVNDLRYGYVRQGYSIRGLGQEDYVTLRFMTQPVPNAGTNPTSIVSVPVHNVIDNVTWIKGRHTLSAGGNWRRVDNISDTNANSYNNASTNEDWLANSGAIAGQSLANGTVQSLDPGGFGFPAVDSASFIAYNDAIGLLTGLVPQATGQYNFQVSPNGATGTILQDGAYIQRHFHNNEFEYFLQDSFRFRPNLTLTFGIRHTILQTPYEVNGQQIAPTIDTHAWFMKRGSEAAQGQVYEPDLTFAPSGQARGKAPYWPTLWGNIAPRLAIAYAPTAKISIRAGAGIYYDHFGQGITNSFDQLGSFGSQTTLQNPANSFTVDNTPRFTGLQNLPTPLPGAGMTSAVYPYTPPELGGINWGIDSRIKTPYSETFDFSIQREVGGGFTFETSYVGRFGRHLLQQLDLAEPVNLVDPASGMDYFTAGTMLSKLVDQNATAAGYNPQAQVPAIPYFENLFPDAAGTAVGGVGTPGASATQNIYSLLWSQNRGNETGALITMDEGCYPGCGGKLNRYWQKQFTSLYAWSSIGVSSYNAAQLTLRHAMSHGLQMDASYTLSKSIDMGSDTERTGELNSAGSFSEIINSWKPKLNRAVSDFDTRNLVTVNGVYELPFGSGQRFASGVNGIGNALLGGWQYSGLGRWSSGLPFTVIESEWTTNWQIQSAMVQTAFIKMRRHILPTGAPEAFDNPDAINNGYMSGSPLRLPYPGEAGGRNIFRGDGYFDIDSGLSKTWALSERQALKFAWEVFNVTNSVRFDTSPVSSKGGWSSEIGSPSLGVYSSTLSVPRVMQFSLRYSF